MPRPYIACLALFLALTVHAAPAFSADANQIYLDGVTLYQSGKYEAAEKLFTDALKANPRHVSSLYMMGETVSRDIRRLKEAEGWYRKAVAECKGDKVYMPKFISALGKLYMRLGRDEDALGMFQTLVTQYPDYFDMPSVYNHMGIAYYHMDSYDEARGCFKTALQKDPGLLEATFNMKTLQGQLALLNIARYFQRMGDEASAVEQYNKAIEAYPNYVAAWYNLGMVDLGRGEFREAARHLARAGALNPAYMGGREIPYELARAYTGRGEPGDMEAALGIYEKNVGYKDALVMAGTISFELGQLEKAEAYLGRATTEVEGKKAQAEAWYQLGLVQKARGASEDSVQSFLKAMELVPEDDRYRHPPVSPGQK
ncbi:MAG: tetratricopeptide repeat protein [Nitrospirae bacterium]|nr:tetratricopeptide repeat protein [Nitrospirota bacterium]